VGRQDVTSSTEENRAGKGRAQRSRSLLPFSFLERYENDAADGGMREKVETRREKAGGY